MILLASVSSSPVQRSTDPARWLIIARIMSSLATSVWPSHSIAAVEDRDMAVAVDRGLQRLAEDRRDVERAQPHRHRGADHAAQPLGIERSDEVGDQPRRAETQPAALLRTLAGCGEEAAGCAGEVQPSHPSRHDRGSEEVLAQEGGEAVADPVLVARDDRGVRDGQAERVAEQRGHREPVGQPADHRRFGKGAHRSPSRDDAPPAARAAR